VKNINGVDKRISYIVWTPKDGVEARSAATVQIHGNVAEKRMQDSQEDHAKQQRIKEVMISLAGLTQAYINAGVLDISEALEKASIARNLIIEKAISIVDHQ
jgi:hypothetical protein